MSYIDVTGKTEEEAIRKGLEQLGMDRDDVSVEILERAKSGFLGTGSAPARDDKGDDVLDGLTKDVWDQGPDAVLARCPGRFDPLFAESRAFRRLRQAWKDHGGWPELLSFVSFRRDIDMVRGQAEYVQLMTMHASKGLEFKAVFIPGMEDGLLPFRGVGSLLNKPDDFTPPPVEEEERLLYVGITRASEAVFLSSAASRTLYGHTLALPPSPLLPLSHFHAVKLTRRTKTTASQLSLF